MQLSTGRGTFKTVGVSYRPGTTVYAKRVPCSRCGIYFELHSDSGKKFPDLCIDCYPVAEECGKGHPFTDENTLFPPSGGRKCRTCQRAAAARRKARRRAAVAA